MNNGNLFQFLRNQRKRPPKNILRRIFFEICKGVAFMHSRNMIHRDLKPENILLDDSLTPKICDFGWSTFLTQKETRETFCGTYEYMAPEIFESEQYDKAVDIWSLGIMLYEIFHLHSPFVGKTAFKIYRNIVEEKIIIKRDLDSDVSDLIMRILKTNPNQRPSIK